MTTDKKKVVVVSVLAILVIAGISIAIFSGKNPATPDVSGVNGGSKVPEPSKTASSVPGNAVVLDPNSKDAAAPVAVKSLSGKTGVDDRTFNISLSGNALTPSNISIYLYDLVNINFTSDRDLDFIQPDLGLSWNVRAGQTTTIKNFQGVMSGKFLYYCKSCGGPDKGPVGYFTIVPKNK